MVLEFYLDSKRRNASQCDRNDLFADGFNSAVAVCLARIGEMCQWAGVDLLLEGDRGEVTAIVIVVVVSEFDELVFYQTRLRSVQLDS